MLKGKDYHAAHHCHDNDADDEQCKPNAALLRLRQAKVLRSLCDLLQLDIRIRVGVHFNRNRVSGLGSVLLRIAPERIFAARLHKAP